MVRAKIKLETESISREESVKGKCGPTRIPARLLPNDRLVHNAFISCNVGRGERKKKYDTKSGEKEKRERRCGGNGCSGERF